VTKIKRTSLDGSLFDQSGFCGNLSGLRTPQEKERVKRVSGRAPGIIKIEPSADRAIDRLVSPAETLYELSRKGMIYGLTEEEKKLLKDSKSKRPIARAFFVVKHPIQVQMECDVLIPAHLKRRFFVLAGYRPSALAIGSPRY